MWKSVSRNKRSVTLNLRCAEGQDLVRQLVSRADVLIVNTRPQTLRKWGLDDEHLRVVNERLVMLHITGYGLTGPKSERPGFGTLGEAMSGFAHITGEADGPPTLPPFMLADGVASLNAAYAVMMALYHRDVHGAPGQLIDVNLIDPLARLLEQTLLDMTSWVWYPCGPETVGTSRLRATPIAPPTASGWPCPAARRPWRCGCSRAIGRSDLVDDADFSDPQRRLAKAPEVDAVVAEWVGTKTLSEAMTAIRGRRGCRRPRLRHHPVGGRRQTGTPGGVRSSEGRTPRCDDGASSGAEARGHTRTDRSPRPHARRAQRRGIRRTSWPVPQRYR